MNKRPKHLLWLLQAEADLRSTIANRDAGLFAHACFAAQQASEKALKALAYFRGADLVKSHSLGTIIKDLAINGILTGYALQLDLYYLATRYPDALPDDVVPAERFSEDQANSAIEMAKAFLDCAKAELNR